MVTSDGNSFPVGNPKSGMFHVNTYMHDFDLKLKQNILKPNCNILKNNNFIPC